MTSIPQMDCCTMLGIDPKTLRNWLRYAHLQFVAHPTDARLKCLTLEQVQQLAALHARPISPRGFRFPGAPTRSHPACFNAFAPFPHSGKRDPGGCRSCLFLGRSRTPKGCLRSGGESDDSARAAGPTHPGTPSRARLRGMNAV